MLALLKTLWEKLWGKEPPEAQPMSLHDPRRSRHWPAVELQHKRREPCCQMCGRMDHLDVHHILPFEDYPWLELDDGIDGTGTDGNLVTLCRPPGSIKGSCHYMHGHKGVSWKAYDPDIRKKCAARRLGLTAFEECEDE